MNIAIIGGGFTGLTAAYELGKYGHHVTLFEKDASLGGLAHGLRQKNWQWSLEKAYHHLFTNDDAMLGLLKELGLERTLIVKRPITANLVKDRIPEAPHQICQLDSPLHLLTFPYLNLLDKLRTGALLAFLKLNPFWQPLERVTAKRFFLSLGGKAAWEAIWEPLMVGKFGDYHDTIAASWLWARIKKRTQKLCYIEGGFQTVVDALEQAIIRRGGCIHVSINVTSIQSTRHPRQTQIKKLSHGFTVAWSKNNGAMKQSNLEKFDRVLLTVPSSVTTKLIEFPKTYIQRLSSIPHLHAQTLILETKEPIVKNTYWLNVTDRAFPFLSVVAHTNFMDKKHYGGHHITYFGNYLPSEHRYLSMTKERLLKEFMPYIQRLNPSCQLSAVSCQLFVGPFAQPIHQLHYSGRAPKLQTPIAGLFLANLDSIYPWDRGTNYAVELGKNAARIILSSRR